MQNRAEKQKENDPVITVEGIIVPVEWDALGRPVALALASDQETEYLVDPEDMTGSALFKFLCRKVKIRGVLDGRTVRSRPVITVKGIVVMSR